MLPSQNQPTRVRWMVAAMLCAAAMLAYLDRGIIRNVVIEIQAELKLSDWQAGWVLTAFVVGYAGLQIPAGLVGDRIAVRFALPVIVVLWSLMTGLTALASSLVALLAVRFGFGIAQAGVFPFSIPALRRWFPIQSRGMAQGFVTSGARIGLILAALAAIPIARLGWEVTFLGCALLGLVWAVVFAVWFRDQPRAHSAANEEEVALIGLQEKQGEAPPHIPLLRLLGNRNIIGLCLGQVFAAMGYYLFLTWFPTYLREEFSINLEQAGTLAVGPDIGGLIGSALGGQAVDLLFRKLGSLRWSRSIVWISGKAGCGLLFLVAACMPNPYLLVAVISLAAALSDAGNPADWTAVTDIGGRQAGTVFGIQNCAGGIGAFICPLLIADIHDRWGWGPVLPVFAAIHLIAAATWIWVDASRPISETQPASADNKPC